MEFALEGLGWKSFQDLALMYVQQQFGVAAVSFAAGPDLGRDGAGLIMNKPHDDYGHIAIQAKHTGRAANLRISDVQAELPKITTLAQRGLCDSYVFITNRTVSAPVQGECVKAFEKAGAKKAIVVGRDELVRRLTEDKVLRGLIPRVYGLGDFSEILDERLYGQTLELIHSNEMDRFVATTPYLQTLSALENHSFSLILGEPASGKSSIMRAAAIHCADRWDLAPMWLDSITELKPHWNHDRADQLFLLDDAFGMTNHDPLRCDEWNRAIPRVHAAIRLGARFVLTSRDYVYRAAKPSLKSENLPVSHDTEVVIELNQMPLPDRRQILYNHMRLGDQPREFLTAAKPHLAQLTASPRFLPETARRLGDPRFTDGLDPSSVRDLTRFVDEPRPYLLEIIQGLEERLQIGLLLLMASDGPVSSPLDPTGMVAPLLERFGLNLWDIARGLDEMDGDLVRLHDVDGERHWSVRHPTVIDAMGDWLRGSPELIDLYCGHAPLAELRRQTVCGRNVEGPVQLPRSVWHIVFDRMLASVDDTDDALRYFASRCSWEAIKASGRLDDVAGLLYRRQFTSPLDGDPMVRLYLRLSTCGALDGAVQMRLLDDAIDVAIARFDPYVLTNAKFEELASGSEQDEHWPSVVERFLGRCRDGLAAEVDSRLKADDSGVDRPDAVVDLATLFECLKAWTHDDELLELFETQHARISEWAGDDSPRRGLTDTMKLLVDAVFGFRSVTDDIFIDLDEYAASDAPG